MGLYIFILFKVNIGSITDLGTVCNVQIRKFPKKSIGPRTEIVLQENKTGNVGLQHQTQNNSEISDYH